MIYHIEESILLRDFLVDKVSKAMLKRIKREGDLLVNQKHQTVRYMLQAGDVLEIVLPQEDSSIAPEAIPLTIVYEDDYYLIIDKKAGMPCIPTKRYQSGTLAHALMHYYKLHNIHATIHLVNRLDKETSGYMLVAKSSQAHALLSTDIKQVKRVYHCLVDGIIKQAGVVEAPIARREDSTRRYVSPLGQYAKTLYRPIKYYDNQTLVECMLETGRTHQIRVHMAHLGHPLSGDEFYNTNQKEYYLESVEISFLHPYTHQLIHLKKV